MYSKRKLVIVGALCGSVALGLACGASNALKGGAVGAGPFVVAHGTTFVYRLT